MNVKADSCPSPPPSQVLYAKEPICWQGGGRRESRRGSKCRRREDDSELLTGFRSAEKVRALLFCDLQLFFITPISILKILLGFASLWVKKLYICSPLLRSNSYFFKSLSCIFGVKSLWKQF